MDPLRCYREVWEVDTEFTAPPGHRPAPLCLVAKELRTGRIARKWLHNTDPGQPPYKADPETLMVAYYASAEWGCHRALGWPMPVRSLDLFAEFSCLTAGTNPPNGRTLLGALTYHGLPALDAVEKESMRSLAMRGGPYTHGEREALLVYCQSDVDALSRLLPKMLPKIDFPRALLRGRYPVAAAQMEWCGVPVDTETLDRLLTNWDCIRGRLVAAVNRDYGVYEPIGRTISPNTVLGATLAETAKEFGINIYALADMVDMLWREEKGRYNETVEAVQTARQMTGLTAQKMHRLVDAGDDHTSVFGLDITAREVAGMFPELSIGRGHANTTGDDYDDNAAELFDRLRNPIPRPRAKHELVQDAAYRLTAESSNGFSEYTGPMRFSSAKFGEYLSRHNISWPQLESGALALDNDTFKQLAKLYPDQIGPIREVRHILGQLRLNELAVGPDGRNRVLLSMFGSKTGRNQPSNSKFIFGPSCWLRSLIRPEPGRAISYCDWSAQEFGIAAVLSKDQQMQEAYTSGDPYLWFGKFAKLVPQDATKKTHGAERDRFKVMLLGVLYGLSVNGLARNLGTTPAHGRELMQLHRETFRRFWQWSDAVQDHAMLGGELRTVFGWRMRAGKDATPTSLRNFPIQSSGSEMLRLAACLSTERGIKVCCPIHDAFMIEANAEAIGAETDRMKAAMQEASELVLPGFPLRTDAKIVSYPGRYMDGRGKAVWETVMAILDTVDPLGLGGIPE